MTGQGGSGAGAGADAGAGASGGSAASSSAKSSGGGCQLSLTPSYSLLEPSLLALCLCWQAVRRSVRGRRRSSVLPTLRAAS
jgi:hypothetical protein